jgi:type IV pilus assembly protein PilC
MLFSYKAVKKNEVVSGRVEANSELDAISFLKANNYFPIHLKEIQASSEVSASFFSRTNYSDIVNFTQQLAIMLNAGLTLIDAFDILKKQTSKQAFLKIILSIDRDLRGGTSFSESLRKFPSHFSNLYISLVKAGEASGKLNDVMLRLSDNLEKSREFRAKLKGAMIYPALIVVAMFAAGFIMMTFVVPQLLKLFKDLNADLPIQTQILIGVSSFFATFWWLILIVIFGGTFLFKKYISTPAGKYTMDATMLKIPVIDNVIKMSTLVDSTRTLAVLISSGVSILDGLRIIIDTTTNSIYKKAFKNILVQVERGTSLGQAMINEEVFPPILVQMTLVGEQTGHLDETLGRVSTYFQLESETAIKALTTLIEPTILVVLGVGVGFLVMSIIAPLYSIGNAIH